MMVVPTNIIMNQHRKVRVWMHLRVARSGQQKSFTSVSALSCEIFILNNLYNFIRKDNPLGKDEKPPSIPGIDCKIEECQSTHDISTKLGQECKSMGDGTRGAFAVRMPLFRDLNEYNQGTYHYQMYFHQQFKSEEQECDGLAIKNQSRAVRAKQSSYNYEKFLVLFAKYRYVFLLLLCVILLFLVITYAKMIFAIRSNISELIALQRSTYSRDISNVQIDLDDEHKQAQQIVTQEQILLAQKWKGIRNEDLQIFSDLANEELEYYQEKYNIIDYEQQPFCIIVYNLDDADSEGRLENIKSILMQNYNNYHIVYVDKNPEQDGEGSERNDIQKLLIEHNQKKVYKLSYKKGKRKIDYHVTIHADDSIGYIENLYIIAESNCKVNQLLLFIDSSDYFIGKQVLKLFNAVYQDKKYKFAYTNFLDANNEIGNLAFMGKKKINKTQIISNSNIQAPLFVVSAKTLTDVIELYIQNRLIYEETDQKIRVELMLPILEYVRGNTIYIPEVNHALDFVKNKDQRKQETHKNSK